MFSLFTVAFLSACSSEKATDTVKIYNEAIKKTVEIRCSNSENKVGYATGCVVSNDGQILTNKHVVFSKDVLFEKIEVRFYNSDNYILATLVKISETDDLALLKIDNETKDYFSLGHVIYGGERVYTVGNPNGYGLSFSEGVVSSPLRYVKYEDDEMKTTQTSITINEGNSGGPLMINDARYSLNTYTLNDEDARRVAVAAGGAAARHRPHIGEGKKGVFFSHYHPGAKPKRGTPHSFYGAPTITL